MNTSLSTPARTQHQDMERITLAGAFGPSLYLYDAQRKREFLRYIGPFRDEAQRELHVAAILAQRAEKQRQHDQRVQEKRATKAASGNPYRVGQILNYSWGYDQTNQEYAVIVSVSPRSVVLREVRQVLMDAGGPSGDRVVPDPLNAEEGSGKTWRVALQVCGNSVYLPASLGHSWSPWDGKADYQTDPSFGH